VWFTTIQDIIYLILFYLHFSPHFMMKRTTKKIEFIFGFYFICFANFNIKFIVVTWFQIHQKTIIIITFFTSSLFEEWVKEWVEECLKKEINFKREKAKKIYHISILTHTPWFKFLKFFASFIYFSPQPIEKSLVFICNQSEFFFRRDVLVLMVEWTTLQKT
jgi:hypothetical protein